MPSTIYYIFNKNVQATLAPACHDYVLAGMQRVGAVVMEERQFALHAFCDRKVQPTDKVVGFFITDENSKLIYSTVNPENRWVHLIDTRVNLDGQAYVGRIDYCRQHSINRVVVTYQNADHIDQLKQAGIMSIVMPWCASRRRKRIEKQRIISAAGTFEADTYPTRVRIKNLLQHLIVPASTNFIKGDQYYDVLDQFQFGVVCKGGRRDCLVTKYVEFGMCHVLPIGDCPSYMPEDMQRLMINVEGKSDEWVLAEVQRLLHTPNELYARQEAYSELVHQRYDLLTNAKRVIDTIARI